ncbi:hypothetical protein LDC_2913 [sediment metagenome]|uniref:Uncharacterized protein n=1 Tax=sediment metagenome TaxID=749907 RepID=D9PMY4_9ZZZZ
MNDLLNPSPGQVAVRRKIDDLEAAIRGAVAAGEMEQTFHDGTTEEGDREAEHHFAQGVYARSMWLPGDGYCRANAHPIPDLYRVGGTLQVVG